MERLLKAPLHFYYCSSEFESNHGFLKSPGRGKKKSLLAEGDLLRHEVSSAESTELCAFATWRAMGDGERLI